MFKPFMMRLLGILGVMAFLAAVAVPAQAASFDWTFKGVCCINSRNFHDYQDRKCLDRCRHHLAGHGSSPRCGRVQDSTLQIERYEGRKLPDRVWQW